MFLAIAGIVFAQWVTIQSRIGASLGLPEDMHLWYEMPISADKPKGPIGSEIYSSHGGKSMVALTQRDIPNDENPRDSEATRLDYFVLNEVDLATSKFSLIRHSTHTGWPAVDFEIAPAKGAKAVLGGSTFEVGSDFGAVRYRAIRTKSKYFVIEIWGQITSLERQHIVDSLQLPKEAGIGAQLKWGPEAKTQTVANSLVEVWSPIEFKFDSSARGPDNTTELKSYKAEFGCEKLVIGVLDLPPGGEDQIDDSFLQQIIESTAGEAEQHLKVTLGEVKNYKKGSLTFHFTIGRTASADVRIDVAISGSHLFIFTIAVPHGMLESEDIKRFVGSFSIK